MARMIFWQFVIAVMLVAVAAGLGGQTAAVSSALAGLSCVIPNAIFAMGLHFSERNTHRPGYFYIWELIKIVLTIVLMVAAFWWYKDLSWLAFLVSFIVVLKSYIFLLYKYRN